MLFFSKYSSADKYFDDIAEYKLILVPLASTKELLGTKCSKDCPPKAAFTHTTLCPVFS